MEELGDDEELLSEGTVLHLSASLFPPSFHCPRSLWDLSFSPLAVGPKVRKRFPTPCEAGSTGWGWGALWRAAGRCRKGSRNPGVDAKEGRRRPGEGSGEGPAHPGRGLSHRFLGFPAPPGAGCRPSAATARDPLGSILRQAVASQIKS